MTTHTPWYGDGEPVAYSSQPMILIYREDGSEVGFAIDRTDALLFAASQDLLAALKKAREWVDLGPELPGISAKDEAEARQVLAEIDTAIARVEATP